MISMIIQCIMDMIASANQRNFGPSKIINFVSTIIEPQLKISCGFSEIPLHNYVVHIKYQTALRNLFQTLSIHIINLSLSLSLSFSLSLSTFYIHKNSFKYGTHSLFL